PFDDGTPAVTVHRLVQAIARGGQGSDLAQAAAARLVTWLSAIYPRSIYDDPGSWPLCAQLTPHVLALRDNNSDGTTKRSEWLELLDRSAEYVFARGSYAQAEPLMREAIAVREKILGRDHPTLAASLSNQADLLWAQRDPAAARECFDQALAINEKV